MADNTIELVLRSIDQSSGELAKTERSVDALTNTIKKLQSSLSGSGRSINLGSVQRDIEAFAKQSQQTISRVQSTTGALRGAPGLGVSGGATAAAASAAAQLTNNSKALNAALQQTGKTSMQTSQATSGMAQSFGAASSAATLLGTVITSIALKQFVQGIVETQISLDKITRFFAIAAGSAQGAATDLAFVRAEAERLGLPFQQLAESFGKFAVAANQAGFSTEEVRHIFTGTTEALTVMNAGAQDTQLVFLALEQMVSKGTVSMEELRRQLGERIPGAFNMAAKAMGKTTAELNDMISKGQVTARELLPKLATEFQRVFGPQVPAAAADVQSAIARVHNAVFDLLKEVGESGAMQSFRDVLSEVAKTLGDPQVVANISAITGGLAGLVAHVIANQKWYLLLGSAVAFATGHGLTFVAMLGALGIQLVNTGDKFDQVRRREEEFRKAQAASTEAATTLAQKMKISADELQRMDPKVLQKRLQDLKLDTDDAAIAFSTLADKTRMADAEWRRSYYGTKMKEAQKQVDDLTTSITEQEATLKSLGLTTKEFLTKPIEELQQKIKSAGPGPASLLADQLLQQRGALDKANASLKGYTKTLTDFEKAQLAATKKAGEKPAVVDDKAAKELAKFTDSLEKQLISLRANTIEFNEGSDAALRFSLAMRAVEAGIIKIPFEQALTMPVEDLIAKLEKVSPSAVKLINSISDYTKSLRLAKFAQEELANTPDPFGAIDFKKLTVLREQLNKASFEPLLISQESTVSMLQQQLRLMEEQDRPLSEILAITRAIDEAEKGLLSIRIQAAEAEVALTKARKENQEASEHEVKAAEARLEALRQTVSFAGLGEQAKLREVAKQAGELSAEIADEFTDNLLSSLQGKKNDFDAFFIGIGRTIVSEIIEKAVAALILPSVTQLVGQGTTVNAKGGLGGTLSSLVIGLAKDAFGFGAQAKPAIGASLGLNTGTLLGDTEGALDMTEYGRKLETTATQSLTNAGRMADFNPLGVNLLETLTKVFAQLQSFIAPSGGSTGGFGGLLSSIPFIGGLFGGGAGAAAGGTAVAGALEGLLAMGYAKGGIITAGPRIPYSHPVMTSGMVHKFARGGRVMGGPVLGLLGEEGDEIVARMKPHRGGGSAKAEPQPIVVSVWDRRPPTLSEDEVLVVVERDMRNNGRIARSAQNVIKRTR